MPALLRPTMSIVPVGPALRSQLVPTTISFDETVISGAETTPLTLSNPEADKLTYTDAVTARTSRLDKVDMKIVLPATRLTVLIGPSAVTKISVGAVRSSAAISPVALRFSAEPVLLRLAPRMMLLPDRIEIDPAVSMPGVTGVDPPISFTKSPATSVRSDAVKAAAAAKTERPPGG